MDSVALLVEYAQSAILEEPRKGGFDDPAVLPGTAAVLRVAPGDQRLDASLAQRATNLCFGVFRAIRSVRACLRPVLPKSSSNAGNPVAGGEPDLTGASAP